ncbi:MAG: tetratricopeptide repeat protein [Candidatus Acidiferrum sp.]
MGGLIHFETKTVDRRNNSVTQLRFLRTNRQRRALPLLFLLFLVAPSACPQENPERELDGFVYSANGGGLPDVVRVDLCDDNGITIQQNSTASAGRFYFLGLRGADYVLKVYADSFKPQEVKVSLLFGNVHGVVVYLEPVSSAPSKSSEVSRISSHELSVPDPARELLLAGRKKLYRENNAQGALDDFLHAQRRAPGFYEVDYEIGMAYLNLKQNDNAKKSFAKAVAMSKDTYADPEIALGTLLVDQGDLAEGEKKIQRGIQLNPTLWMGYYQLARLRLIRGQLQEAETNAKQSRSLAPKIAAVYQLLSVIHLRQKNYPELLQDIDMYLTLEPSSPAAQRARSVRAQVAEEIEKGQDQPSGRAKN